MNISSANSVSTAARMLNIASEGNSKALERLATALRINSAADDAAGLAISGQMEGQARGLDMASRNASDSISMLRTGEGALAQTQDSLQRMRELAVQASNGIYTDSDRGQLQAEMNQLRTEIDRIGNTTEFNTRKLLDGTADNVTTQAGANSGQTLSVSFGDSRAAALGIDGLDISTASGAMSALESIDNAIQTVSSQRGNLGANENRLEYTVNNLNVASENQIAAQSRIRDADMAREVMNRSVSDILRQTSLAMLTQGNMLQKNVLQLLG
ncbi:MAG: flagellin [Chitinispirillia bacterium]|nr:flagellin [Chitinispirillia bacterium]MCL2242393.1 flagellin [Chitinispirillia bacterium]